MIKRGIVLSKDASADSVASFENLHPHSSSCKFERCGETGHASAHNEYIRRHRRIGCGMPGADAQNFSISCGRRDRGKEKSRTGRSINRFPQSIQQLHRMCTELPSWALAETCRTV